MATITINGHTFVESSAEAQEGATGFYKVRKRAIDIFDTEMQPMAVVNRELVLGSATRQKDGKVWYGYMPFNHILSNDSYMKQREELETFTKGRDHLGYFFK
jgi:hypothetical protein